MSGRLVHDTRVPCAPRLDCPANKDICRKALERFRYSGLVDP